MEIKVRTHFHNNTINFGGLMVSALNSGLSSPVSSPDQGHCVVFLSLVHTSDITT